jgi:hypothetical protein
MPEPQGQPPAIDLSFLDTDPALIDDADWYEPLTPEQVAALLDEAARAAGDARRLSRIQLRLGRGIQGIPCPCPAAERELALHRLFTDRYREGAAPGLVAELCRLMGTSQAPVKQAFHLLPGLPASDDPELSDLMEVIARLPRANVEEIARDLLRAALARKRTGDPGYLTCLAEDALVTIRLRTDPELDKALAQAPKEPAGPGRSIDVEDMLRERGL